MAGGGALQLLRGRITADGNIQCFCVRCQGHQKIPNSVFEEHAGSKVCFGGGRGRQQIMHQLLQPVLSLPSKALQSCHVARFQQLLG